MEVTVYEIENLKELGYEEDYVEIVRYINGEMVVIENVKVYTKCNSELDNERIELHIPEESRLYIESQLNEYKEELERTYVK